MREREQARGRDTARHNTPPSHFSSSSFHPRNGQSVSAKVGCSVGTLPERERHVLGVPAAPTRLPGAGPAAVQGSRERAHRVSE